MKTLSKRIKAVLCASILTLTLTAAFPQELAAADTLYTRDPFASDEDVNRWESEHFQFVWGKNGADSSKISTQFLEGNAANLEKCYDIYVDELGMNPPSESVEAYLRDGKKYKTNIYISGTGLADFPDDWAYMGYDSGGYAFMFCCVGAMEYNPPSWVLPHEFAHVMTAHQYGWNRNKYSGAWWEATANWFREEWLYATGNKVGYGTDFFETYLKNLNLTFPCGRDYYASWPFLIYLTENPDNMPDYGENFVRTMLQQGQTDEYPLSMVERLSSADFKETLGNYAKHMATFDFENQSSYRARMDELCARGDWNQQQIYTMLEPNGNGAYSVPTERAPQHAGMNIIPLTHSSRSITASLNGLTDVKGADWRACIVLEDKNGKTTYSKLFGNGESASIDVSPDITSAYLTVIATPDSDTYVKCGLPYGGDSEFSEKTLPFSAKTRYPYEVTLDGAKPLGLTLNVNKANGHSHSNGGGYVANTASVADSVYVGPDAMVLGYATVKDNVIITDHAVVEGNAQVSGNAVISGYGMVCERAKVYGNALVSDCGLVMENADVSGNAKVIESALIYGTYSLKDNAVAKGMAFCMYNGSASGQGIVDGDYYDDGGKTITKGTACGWVCDQSYVNSRPYTDGLYNSYEFTQDSDSIVKDKYTETYGVSFGSPLWESRRTSADGVITLDGTSQYVGLDESLCYFEDTEIQFGALWRGGEADSKLFYIGGTDAYMYFTPSNADGAAEFVISDGSSVQRLTADKALVKGEWSTVRVILTGDSGVLKINGQTAASASIKLDPIDVSLSAGDSLAAYLGRGESGGYFNGSVDFFSVFFKEATEPEYYYTEKEDIDPPSVTLWGDANCDGKVNVQDVAMLAKAALNMLELEGQGRLNADCKNDGKLNVQDVAIVAKLAINLLSQSEMPVA